MSFHATPPPRFIVDARKAKEKENKENERREKAEEERKEAARREEERRSLEKKRKAEMDENKENLKACGKGNRAKRQCTAVAEKKIKRDAENEAQPEVMIVSDVRQALKELSDFEDSSQSSSSDDEWAESRWGKKKTKKTKVKSKGKKTVTKKSSKTIIFRHDPSRNPFIPPSVVKPKEEEFEGFEDEDVRLAEESARKKFCEIESKQECNVAFENKVILPEIRFGTRREVLIDQERKFSDTLLGGLGMNEECFGRMISEMMEETIQVLHGDCRDLDVVSIFSPEADRGIVNFSKIEALLDDEDSAEDDDDYVDENNNQNALDRAISREQKKYARLSGHDDVKMRPLRKVASSVKNYVVPEVSDEETEEDKLLIPCTWCPDPHKFGICSKNPGKLPNYIQNKTVVEGTGSKLSRAEASLPDHMSIRESRISGADMGVWYKYISSARSDKSPLLRGTIFGPYEGRILSSEEEADRSGTAWEVRLSSGKTVYVDGGDDAEANWLKYVNCSRNAKEQNLYAFDFNGAIYYLVIRDILPGSELLVYYGDAYANTLSVYDEPNPDKNDEMFCQICKAYFKSFDALKLHLAQNHDDDWPCDLCGFIGKSEISLNAHLKRKHTETYKFSCSECDFKTNDRICYERHRQVHDKKRPFVCGVCQKGFTRLADLRRHEIIHSGERPFPCDQCGKCYNNPGSLGRHKREIHEQQAGKHKCDICGKRFTRPSDLINHIRVHTGEKPFSCSICSRAFSVNGYRRQHEKNVHGIDPT